MASTINQDYFDAQIRHQIYLRRFASGEVKKILDILQKSDQQFVTMLRERLVDRIGKPVDFTTKVWGDMLQEFQDAREQMYKAIAEQAQVSLHGLAENEAGVDARIIQAIVPFEVTFATVSIARLRAIVNVDPFLGRTLKDWFATLRASEQLKLKDALQMGMAQGESVDQMVRRVAGTRAARFSDGILSISRRSAESIVRTAVNAVSNAARDEVFSDNQDIMQCLRWASTLDGRTSKICRSRDGKVAPVGDDFPEDFDPPAGDRLEPPNARPPAHMGCRSIMIAVLRGLGLLGSRPTVEDTRRRGEREADFRAEARASGRPIQDIRSDWADEHVGSVPAETTYGEWLKSQEASFQDEVLGPTRGALFRRGGLTVDEFVDRQGNEYTLDQLARSRPEAFTRANLDPAEFR